MRVRTAWTLAALMVTTTACTAILGDFDLDQTDAGSSQTDAATDGTNNGETGPGDAGCITGQTSCSTGCVDLQKSATNCGACSHSCNAGSCNSGACGPYVIAKQPTTGSVAKLATDGTRVVWADTGIVAINQIAAAGGSAITLAAVSPTSGAIGSELGLSNNGIVAFNYVGGSSPPSVGLAAVDTPNSGAAVFNGIVQISSISINPSGTHVVYVNSHGMASDLNDCAITATRDAGTCGPGVAGGRFGSQTATDDGFFFFDVTEFNDVGQPSQDGLYLSTLGTDVFNIFTPASATSLRVDGKWAYWTQTTTFADGGPAFSLQRTLEATPGTPQQNPVAAMPSSSFATDSINLYYWNGSSIVSRPVAGGSDTVLAPASAFVDIAVGGKLVVWTDGAVINGIVLP